MVGRKAQAEGGDLARDEAAESVLTPPADAQDVTAAMVLHAEGRGADVGGDVHLAALLFLFTY